MNDIAALLSEVASFVRRYVVISELQADAVALWVAHTHAFDAARTTPYLHVTSAEPECGKSRLFEVAKLLVARPFKVSAISTAALMRKVDRDRPTLLLDESDNALKRDKEYVAGVLQLLNDGYRVGGIAAVCVGKSHDLQEFSTFSPKAFAGIGDLPHALASRCIRIELQRRKAGEIIEDFYLEDAEPVATPLRTQLEEWAAEQLETLSSARPDRIDGLRDRTQESWTLPFAIADVAGDDWPRRARSAALALAGGAARADDSDGIRLLSDIREIFRERSVDQLLSVSILEALHEIDEAPWGDWYGRKISSRAVSKLLKKYGLPGTSSTSIWIDGKSAKGYRRDQFEDVWSRFLPAITAPIGETGEKKHGYEQNRAPQSGEATPSLTGSEDAANGDGKPSLTGLTDSEREQMIFRDCDHDAQAGFGEWVA